MKSASRFTRRLIPYYNKTLKISRENLTTRKKSKITAEDAKNADDPDLRLIREDLSVISAHSVEKSIYYEAVKLVSFKKYKLFV